MNEGRKACVMKAYGKLDVNGDQQVKLDDIARLYDASQHPEVMDGRRSERDVFMEFMSLWDTQERDGVVSCAEFCAYYEDISHAFEKDEDFCSFMKNVWKYDC